MDIVFSAMSLMSIAAPAVVDVVLVLVIVYSWGLVMVFCWRRIGLNFLLLLFAGLYPHVPLLFFGWMVLDVFQPWWVKHLVAEAVSEVSCH